MHLPARYQVINQPFSLFLAARVLATGAIRMVPTLLGWYIYEITNSALALGLLGLSEVIPAIAFALPAGVRVDRSSRLKMIQRCLFLYLLVLITLFGLTSMYATSFISTHVMAWAIYGIVGLTGWIRAYYSPASSAALSQLVQPEQLVGAATTNSISWLAAAILGPLLGGILIGFGSMSLAFAVCIIFILLSLWLMTQVIPLNEFIPKKLPGTWASVKDGLDFVIKKKALLGSMSLDMFAVLFGGAVALLPVFAKDILHVGAQGYGLLSSATYLGNFIALLYFYHRPIAVQQGRKLIYAVGGFGVCMLIFALSNSFIISFIALLVSGLFDGVSMVVRSTIFQLLVPDEMRGRVSSVSSIFINSSNELGQFESGAASSLMGTVPSVIFGGLMTIGISIFTYVKVPSLRKLQY